MNTIEPRARASDPETSHDAAWSVTGLRGKLADVLYEFKRGPHTLEELVDFYLHHASIGRVSLQSPSGIRSRCSELVKLGLVEDSGERRNSRSGRASIVWRVKA